MCASRRPRRSTLTGPWPTWVGPTGPAQGRALRHLGQDRATRSAASTRLLRRLLQPRNFTSRLPRRRARARGVASGVADLRSPRSARSGDATGLAQAMEAAGAGAGVGDIRLATQRSLLTRRLLDEMGLREVELINTNAPRSRRGEALAERLDRGAQGAVRRGPAYVDRQARLYAAGAGRRCARDAGQEGANATAPSRRRTLAMMQALVRRMAKRLAERYRDAGDTAKRGKLDVRKTAAPIHGPRRRALRDRVEDHEDRQAKIVVICDVSRSVAAAAQFLLLFLYALNEVVERLDAYAFSDRLIAGQRPPRRQRRRRRHRQGSAAASASARPTTAARSRTSARITRTASTAAPPSSSWATAAPTSPIRASTSCALIQQRARAVIWLNPEPDSYWGQGDSVMHRYQRFTHVAKPCNTLGQLERIIEDVLGPTFRTRIRHCDLYYIWYDTSSGQRPNLQPERTPRMALRLGLTHAQSAVLHDGGR